MSREQRRRPHLGPAGRRGVAHVHGHAGHAREPPGRAAPQVPFEVDPDFAVDTYKTLPNGQPNPHYGDLYVAWVRVYPAGQFPGDPSSTDGTDIMFAVSTDGGQTWATQLQTQPAPGDRGNVQVSVIRDPLYGTDDTGRRGQGVLFLPPGLGRSGRRHLRLRVQRRLLLRLPLDRRRGQLRRPRLQRPARHAVPDLVLPAGDICSATPSAPFRSATSSPTRATPAGSTSSRPTVSATST